MTAAECPFKLTIVDMVHQHLQVRVRLAAVVPLAENLLLAVRWRFRDGRLGHVRDVADNSTTIPARSMQIN